MDKRFILLEETGELINEFELGYMIKSSLRAITAFREKVGKCMNTTFGELTQPFIKKNTF